MNTDNDNEGEDEEGGSSHTGAIQDLQNLEIDLDRPTRKDKDKGKQIEIESDNESEISNNGDKEDDGNLSNRQNVNKRKRVTIREFVVYRIQVRNLANILHLSGRLFQQYLVDQYAKWETNNLRWHKENQENLRIEMYSGLHDVVSDDDHQIEKIGTKIILSSSFTGSTRYMQQLYQDSMAIVREFGKPDLFVTVTCNPK